jgi:hypothetical protein
MSERSERKTDYIWQMSLRSARTGERRGVALELYNPVIDKYLVIELWGGEVSYKPPNSRRDLARRFVSRFEKKLKDHGLEIPNFRDRLLDLLKQRWGLG